MAFLQGQLRDKERRIQAVSTQLGEAEERGAQLGRARPDIDVLIAPTADGELRADVSLALADEANGRLDGVTTLVIIGGDTAAALLGDAPRRVHGTVLPGLPWSLDEHDGGPVVVTKAGGFGDEHTLVRLLSSG